MTKPRDRSKTGHETIKNMWGKIARATAKQALSRADRIMDTYDAKEIEQIGISAEGFYDRAGAAASKHNGL